jgi:hypothetical protein
LSIASVHNQNLNETVRNATVSVPPTENVIYIGNSSVNAIQDMDFVSFFIEVSLLCPEILMMCQDATPASSISVIEVALIEWFL